MRIPLNISPEWMKTTFDSTSKPEKKLLKQAVKHLSQAQRRAVLEALSRHRECERS